MTNIAVPKTSVVHRRIIACLLAGIAGLIAPFLLMAAWGFLSNLIDPHARILAFLMRPPHHPVRLTVAGISLPLFLGAGVGIGLYIVSNWLNRPNRWLIWFIFIGGFIAAILISAPSFHPLPVTGLIRFSVFLTASAIAFQLFLRSRCAQVASASSR